MYSFVLIKKLIISRCSYFNHLDKGMGKGWIIFLFVFSLQRVKDHSLDQDRMTRNGHLKLYINTYWPMNNRNNQSSLSTFYPQNSFTNRARKERMFDSQRNEMGKSIFRVRLEFCPRGWQLAVRVYEILGSALFVIPWFCPHWSQIWHQLGRVYEIWISCQPLGPV